MYWISWEKMTEPKKCGGLKIRDLQAFNATLLCKQVWRLITKPNLLMSKVLKGKYFPRTDIFYAESKPRDSWLWKSWNGAKYLLKEGYGWLVGCGSKINIWTDSWLNDEHNKKIISPKPSWCNFQIVKDLMNLKGAGWNVDILTQLFNSTKIQAIKKTPISSLGISDRLVWSLSKNDQYSISSGYKVAKLCEKKKKGDERTNARHE